MKTIAISIVIYFVLAFIFKLFGDMSNNAWVNYYWIFSSFFFSILGYQIQKLGKLDIIKKLYHSYDIKLYTNTIITFTAYWGIMLLVRIIVAFKIELYNKIISSARTVTVGGITIILIFIVLIYFTTAKKE